jgi:hypothetical protein
MGWRASAAAALAAFAAAGAIGETPAGLDAAIAPPPGAVTPLDETAAPWAVWQ